MTKELVKEANDYADKHAFRVPYDGSNKFYDDVDFKASKEGYLASAEPREKRIADLEEAKANLEYLLEGRDNEIDKLKEENKVLAQNLEDTEILNNAYEKRFKDLKKKVESLGKRCLQLQKDKGNLTDRVRELEQQIDKMKCCSMCKHYSMSFLPYWCTKNNTAPHCTSKCDKWEIKGK